MLSLYCTRLLEAEPIIDDEPFFYLWGDDFIETPEDTPSRCQQLLQTFNQFPGQILSGIRTSREEDTRRYGYAAGKEVADGIIKVEDVIEKPGPKNAPSDLAIVSGFLFTPEMIEAVKSLPEPEPGKELVYVDALRVLIEQGKPVYAVEIKKGRFHDCGNMLEYMKTVTEFALKDKEIGPGFKTFLKEIQI